MESDCSLRIDVEHELQWEATVPCIEIGVGVKHGIVTLMGSVDSYAVKRAAERAAARVRGVKAVSNQLTVKLPGPAEPSDSDIAWAAANVLGWNTLVPEKRIRIGVSGGWVTLEGAVDWNFQRTAAEDAVANLAGVIGIMNLIDVQPTIPPDEIKEQLEAALQRNNDLDEHHIIVEVVDDCVTLWGTVKSLAQRDAVAQTAWSAPGVREVSNHTMVEAVTTSV
jgi:osmotically-inducible protein OsmY